MSRFFYLFFKKYFDLCLCETFRSHRGLDTRKISANIHLCWSPDPSTSEPDCLQKAAFAEKMWLRQGHQSGLIQYSICFCKQRTRRHTCPHMPTCMHSHKFTCTHDHEKGRRVLSANQRLHSDKATLPTHYCQMSSLQNSEKTMSVNPANLWSFITAALAD